MDVRNDVTEMGLLDHKRVILTGSRQLIGEIERELVPLGATVAGVSLIESQMLIGSETEWALRRLKQFDWLVFSSGYGVRALFDCLGFYGVDPRELETHKIAVVGRKTGAVLAEYGLRYDFVPAHFTGAELAAEWVPMLDEDDYVLVIRAKDGNLALTQALAGSGRRYVDLEIYENRIDESQAERLNRELVDADYVVFASGSAVRAYAQLLEPGLGGRTRAISIGPTTTDVAVKLGVPIARTAEEYTAAGIVAAMMADVMALEKEE